MAPKLLFGGVRGWAAATESHLDVLITQSLPVVLWSLMLGIHLATQHSRIPREYLHYVPTSLQLLWILSLTIAMSRLAGNTVRFYGGRVAGGAHDVTSLTQKRAHRIVVIVRAVWMLRVVFNLNLTPILTTLGVGGLAASACIARQRFRISSRVSTFRSPGCCASATTSN